MSTSCTVEEIHLQASTFLTFYTLEIIRLRLIHASSPSPSPLHKVFSNISKNKTHTKHWDVKWLRKIFISFRLIFENLKHLVVQLKIHNMNIISSVLMVAQLILDSSLKLTHQLDRVESQVYYARNHTLLTPKICGSWKWATSPWTFRSYTIHELWFSWKLIILNWPRTLTLFYS